MLFLWLRFYFWTVGRGSFHCQKCGGDRPYRQRVARRFFHVFFVPLVPVGKQIELVQCDVCKTRYNTGVLALLTIVQMQETLPAATRAAAIAMLRAGDERHPAARARAAEAIRCSGPAGYDDDALQEDVDSAAAMLTAELVDFTATRVSALNRQLEVPAREWFLAGVVRIGLADEPLTDEERAVAYFVAARLGMTPAQALGVITLTEQAAAAG